MSPEATIEAHEFAVASAKRLPENLPTQIPRSLARLIERAAAGDMVAFEEIMKHSEKRVMRMTWQMLGNEADARDAAQEVFLRVYKYLGRFKQDQPFFAWVYQITLNVCRDIAKKRRQYNTRFTSLENGDNEAAYVVSGDQADAEETLIRAQERIGPRSLGIQRADTWLARFRSLAIAFGAVLLLATLVGLLPT